MERQRNPRSRLLTAALSALSLSVSAHAATFTVNDAGDAVDAVPGNGVCATAGGVCTLRAAIEEANAMAGGDHIDFSIGGGGPVTITATSNLPAITDVTHIHGYTQPGSSPNTLAVGNDAVINVRLDGGGSVATAVSFSGSASNGSSVRGLAVTRFTGTGIAVSGSIGTTIAGNFVGTDGTGADLHNGAYGILIYSNSDDAVVGGPNPADRNVVAWNQADGICVAGSNNVSGTLIRNNYVGIAPDGVTAGRNGASGIRIDGGATGSAVQNNVISASSSAILLTDGGTNQTSILGNFIGVGADGATNIGGGSHGVEVRNGSSGAPNVVWVGGDKSDEGNVIANMAGEGVRVDWGDVANSFPAAVAIRGNAIYNNTGMGIDLSSSATGTGVSLPNANDAGDLDGGANNFQNFPVPTSATTDGAGTTVDLTYDTYALGSFWVDAYASPSCDANGHGEGRVYLGSATVNTDGAGHVSATVSGLPATTVGHFITLTATDTVQWSTSEFSTCLPIAAAGGATPPVMGDVPDQSATVGSPFTMGLVPYVAQTEGDAILSYALASGTLPPGLSLNTANGLVTGTPTTAGSYTVSFTASDDDGASNADSVIFTVADAPAPPVPPGGTMQFSVAAQTVNEADGTVIVTVSRTGGASGPVSIAYATAAGTATAPADFAATSGTLTWADGDSAPKSFSVAIVDDAATESDEQFTVTLTDNTPTDTGSLGTPSTQVVTITDDDDALVAIQPVPVFGPLGQFIVSLLVGLGGLGCRRFVGCHRS